MNKFILLKKISVISCVVIIALYFVGNLGLYLSLKSALNPELEKVIDYLPQKLILKESDIEAESLHFMGFKMKFPFYKKDIGHVSPMFLEHQLHAISIASRNMQAFGHMLFHVYPDRLTESKSSLIHTTWNNLLLKETSFFELKRTVHYARLKNYSSWNLIYNIRLTSLLILKAISLSSFDNFEVYDVETPSLKGMIVQRYRVRDENKTKRATIDFDFRWKDKNVTITFINIDDNNLAKFRKILSSVQPVRNVDKSYTKIKARIKNRGNSGYPEELLLVSLISLKGPTRTDLERLLRIMEGKDYKPYITESLKEEIKYLKDREPSTQFF